MNLGQNTHVWTDFAVMRFLPWQLTSYRCCPQEKRKKGRRGKRVRDEKGEEMEEQEGGEKARRTDGEEMGVGL